MSWSKECHSRRDCERRIDRGTSRVRSEAQRVVNQSMAIQGAHSISEHRNSGVWSIETPSGRPVTSDRSGGIGWMNIGHRGSVNPRRRDRMTTGLLEPHRTSRRPAHAMRGISWCRPAARRLSLSRLSEACPRVTAGRSPSNFSDVALLTEARDALQWT
jgi:hypothetical protein